MNQWIFLIIGILGGIAIFSFLRGRNKSSNENLPMFKMLTDEMKDMRRTLDERMHQSNENLKYQSSESQKLLHEINQQMQKSLIDVTREQTKANEATRQFMTIAEQLANLEKTLKHQKQRGNWGEASLELILQNTLAPGQYTMQYEFINKEKVDAIIITKEGLIPIDAKFSLDNYNRLNQATDERQREELEKDFKADLKKRIDETAKYIRPNEGTLPFAFMYIPAEGIYYDLLVGEVNKASINARNLIDYAYNDKKVVIVSPTTFMAYLQSVLYGFKAFKIEEGAKDIIKRVEELGKQLKAHDDYMDRLGNSLGTTINHYNSAYKELGKLDKDVTRITGESPGIEPKLLDKPNIEEWQKSPS